MGYLEDLQELLNNSPEQAQPPAMPDVTQNSVGSVTPDMVNQYVSQKYGLGQRQALQDQIDTENQGPNWQAALASLGAGLSGGNAAAAGQAVLNQQAGDQNRRLRQFDENALAEKNELAAKRSEAQAKSDNDPNSDASKLAQNLAKDMGVDPSLLPNLTAARFKAIGPTLEKKFKIEQDRLERESSDKNRADMLAVAKQDSANKFALAREDRLAREEDRRSDKAEKEAKDQTEKDLALKTPFGAANTKEDAKEVKDGYIAKKNFDEKLDQMIALREKHKGGSIDPTDVSRGQQLSKDLLLQYKNMAKLGVLSKTDQDTVEAIIPKDPLEFRSIAATALGQDPVLSRLKAFKQDSDKDFATTVKTRLRDDGAQFAAQGGTATAQPISAVKTAPAADAPPPASELKPGYRRGGYEFQGGNPADKKNWLKIPDIAMGDE